MGAATSSGMFINLSFTRKQTDFSRHLLSSFRLSGEDFLHFSFKDLRNLMTHSLSWKSSSNLS